MPHPWARFLVGHFGQEVPPAASCTWVVQETVCCGLRLWVSLSGISSQVGLQATLCDCVWPLTACPALQQSRSIAGCVCHRLGFVDGWYCSLGSEVVQGYCSGSLTMWRQRLFFTVGQYCWPGFCTSVSVEWTLQLLGVSGQTSCSGEIGDYI